MRPGNQRSRIDAVRPPDFLEFVAIEARGPSRVGGGDNDTNQFPEILSDSVGHGRSLEFESMTNGDGLGKYNRESLRRRRLPALRGDFVRDRFESAWGAKVLLSEDARWPFRRVIG
jgi:hypothetical protein